MHTNNCTNTIALTCTNTSGVEQWKDITVTEKEGTSFSDIHWSRRSGRRWGGDEDHREEDEEVKEEEEEVKEEDEEVKEEDEEADDDEEEKEQAKCRNNVGWIQFVKKWNCTE